MSNGMRILGVEFAPLIVPWERRLQTLAVTLWLALLAGGGVVSICFTLYVLLLGCNYARALLILYLIFVYLDSDAHARGGRSGRAQWVRQSGSVRYLRDYFPIRLIKSCELAPGRNYVLGAFPHGTLPFGIGVAFASSAAGVDEKFPGLEFRLLVLDANFLIPFFRELTLAAGACGSSARSMDYLLSTRASDGRSRAVVLTVGGAVEAFKSQPGSSYRIVLRRRKGFVRMALRHGSPLVPVFSFGETDYYDQLTFPEGSLLWRCQRFLLDVTGFAMPVINGRGWFQYSFGLVPRRRPINVVVGAPIEVPRIEHPSAEDVDEYHAIFTEKLIELFETHKRQYAEDPENAELLIDD